MLENDNGLYAALQAKGSRFDGHFFVGASSTGIYCRPVCRARPVKRENCTFYSSAAEAERAGNRPCLVCRPELAPGTSLANVSASLARRAALLIEETCGSGQSLVELAGALGCTERYLRRVFAAEHNVSPVQYQQTCRLLLAKNLLTDTDLPVLDVAMAAGFGSLRRINYVFKEHYRLSPTALRKQRARGAKRTGSVTLALGYRPPYLWERMLKFLAWRAIAGVESVIGEEYARTARFAAADGKAVHGWLRVGNKAKQNILHVTVSETLLPVLPQVLARVRHLFDLCCDPAEIYQTLAPMNAIRAGGCVLGTRVPGCFNAFEMAVRAVLGQQITVKAAGTLAARMVEAYGKPVQTEIAGLTHLFPSPEDLLALDGPVESHFGPLGIIATRSRTILALAQALVNGELDLSLYAQPEEEIRKLAAIPGIGNWTAQYIAMRTMGWPDAFLETDVGLKKALAPHTPREMLQMAEAWRPWRSYATVNLWSSL